MFLKQSTAYTFRLGPFILASDGVSEANSLTIAASAVLLSKAGGAFAAKNDSTALTSTGASGHYTCPLNTTDTNTVGLLRVYCLIATALPVWRDFYVLEEAVYDALFGASAPGYVANAPVSVAQWAGSNVATPTIAGVPEVDITHVIGDAVQASSSKNTNWGGTP